MLVKIAVKEPVVTKTELSESVKHLGRLGKLPVTNTIKIVTQVPNYPETNKNIANTIYNAIMDNAEAIGEIKEITVRRDVRDRAYCIDIIGAKKSVTCQEPVPDGFGEDIKE